jgi:predicted phage-related endonuclease
MLRSAQWPWMLANPDGVCSDGFGYEGKTCSLWKAHEWGTADEPQVPDHAELQAQWGMAVTGLQGWWVAVLIGGQRNAYRLVERDEQIIADLVSMSYRFWHEHVLADVEPVVDGSQAVTDLLTERYRVSTPGAVVEIDTEERDALVVEREKVTAAESAAKKDHEALKNKVRARLGDAEELACGGRALFTWKHTTRFAAARFAEAHPDKAKQYRRQAMVLDTERLAAEEPDLYRKFCSRELRFAG